MTIAFFLQEMVCSSIHNKSLILREVGVGMKDLSQPNMQAWSNALRIRNICFESQYVNFATHVIIWCAMCMYGLVFANLILPCLYWV